MGSRPLAWRKRAWPELVYPVGLAALLLLGGWLRFAYPVWDDLTHANPDERYVVWLATTVDWPETWAEALTPGVSPLDPYHWPPDASSPGLHVPQGEARSYTYGHLALYLVGLGGRGMAALGRVLPQLPLLGSLLNQDGSIPFRHLTLFSRFLSALAGTVTIAISARLARRLFGRAAGLLAAAMVAFAVVHIQASHFGTFDVLLALLASLTVDACVDWAQRGGFARAARAGLWLGLALGCKVSAVWLFVPLLVAALAPALGPGARGRVDRKAQAGEASPQPSRAPGPAAHLLPLCLALAVAALVFIVTNPFAVLEGRQFLAETQTQTLIATGRLDVPFARPYVSTVPYLYPLVQAFRWTLGAPLAVLAVMGVVWGALRLFLALGAELAVLVGWILPFGLYFGGIYAKYPRYLLPILPAVFVLAAGACAWVTQLRRRLGSLLALGALLPTSVYAFSYTAMYREPHPWTTASRWIYANASQEATILQERWDEVLPVQWAAEGRSPYDFDRAWIDSLPTEGPPELEAYVHEIARADYFVMATDVVLTSVSRSPERHALGWAFYQVLFSGQAGFELVAVAHRAPCLLGVCLMDDPVSAAGLDRPAMLEAWIERGLSLGPADSSFTGYDHPWVLVFANTGRLTEESLRSLLVSMLLQV